VVPHPTPDRIVTAREEMGVVRVEAFDASARAADAAVGSRAPMTERERRVPLVCVSIVRGAQLVGIDGRLRVANAARRFQTRDSLRQLGVDEPEASRHRCAVVEQWRVADHDGFSVRAPYDDVERRARRPAEQLREVLHIGVRRRHGFSLRNGGRRRRLGRGEHLVHLFAGEHHVELLASDALNLVRGLQLPVGDLEPPVLLTQHRDIMSGGAYLPTLCEIRLRREHEDEQDRGHTEREQRDTSS